MDWAFYLLALLVAAAITASAVYALSWAVKTGQFNRLEQDARSIFDEEEPVGQVTDAFPGKVKKGKA